MSTSTIARLIDHPGWIACMRHYCGEEQSYTVGLFIDECIPSVCTPGGDDSADIRL